MTKKLDPSYRPEFAVLNGEVVPFGEAKISIMAPGLTFAATVFEGMRAYWNPDHEQLYVLHLPVTAQLVGLSLLNSRPKRAQVWWV